jgi:hypothetical protein
MRLPILGKNWLATTHEVVNEVLKDDQTFVRDARNAGKGNAVGFRWWAWLSPLHPAATAVPKTENKEKTGVRTSRPAPPGGGAALPTLFPPLRSRVTRGRR